MNFDDGGESKEPEGDTTSDGGDEPPLSACANCGCGEGGVLNG